MSDDGKCQKAFASKELYEDAPNPTLDLPDIGPIGLPLSEREAMVIKSRCTRASFNVREGILTEKDTGSIWEMDAKQVSKNDHIRSY